MVYCEAEAVEAAEAFAADCHRERNASAVAGVVVAFGSSITCS